MPEAIDGAPEVPAAALLSSLRPYRTPHSARAILELAITAGPLALLWGLAWLMMKQGHWWGVLLTLPAAAFLLRLFMVQHDCGHGAFFPHKTLNDWTGRVIGVLTLTPYDSWKHAHAKHHATSGDLDRRGFGDVEMLTSAEYLALSPGRRLGYRLFRHPLVMFGLGPAYVFLFRHRLPVGETSEGWRAWFSPMATNLAIAGMTIGLILLGGARTFLLIQLPTSLIAGSIGVWLFYVQHQFEGVAWKRNSGWNFEDAALHGSSHYHLPGPAGWFTANIGVHHVHHLSSRIPFYRLRQVLRDHPELDTGRLSFAQSLRGVGLSLWDEPNQRLISFRELRRQVRRAPAAHGAS
ncbi:MAG TPA: fatty acid desaturase [Caulobacteraceae bacterium]|nr:fatty acid desaturase [Caulobacteraceae bacterium]